MFRTDIPALPFCRLVLKAPKPLSQRYPKELKRLGDHIRKKRIDLKLLQKEVAEKIGVAEASIWNWENNWTEPSLCHIPKIIEFLGYSPYIEASEVLGEKIITFRMIYGLSQERLARYLGIDPGTLARWERDEKQPAKALLDKLNVLFTSFASGALRPGE